MKRLALVALVALAGCQTAQSPEAIALWANLGATALKTELELGVTGLSDADLQTRRRIMASVVPVTDQASVLAASYKTALDSEAARRGLPAKAPRP